MGKWSAIVLAGGSRPQASDVLEAVPAPCLATLANRPLVQYVLDQASRAGADDVLVVSESAIAAAVREAVAPAGAGAMRVRHLEVPDGSGQLAALVAARQELDGGGALVLETDVLAGDDLAPLLERVELEDLDALVVARPESPAAARRRQGVRGKVAVQAPAVAFAGIFILAPSALSLLERVEASAAERGRVADLVDALYGARCRVEAVVAKVVWPFRADPDALLEGHRMVLDWIESDVPDETLADTTVHGRAIVHPTARLQRSLIRGPAVVGREARITDAYVGPYTAVGDDCVIEGTEVEHSILEPRVELRHVGYRVEASVIGAGARVSRTFALPKALHLHVGPNSLVRVS